MAERLMTSLAERGHEVDVVTHFPLKKPPPNYNQISLDGTLPVVVNNMNASNVTTFGNLNVKMLMEVAGTRICELMSHKQFQDILKKPKEYDLIIVEVFYFISFRYIFAFHYQTLFLPLLAFLRNLM